MTCGCGIGHLAVCSSGKKLGTASSISATRKATIDVIFQRGKSSILVVRRLGATRRDRRQRGFDDLDLDAGGDLDPAELGRASRWERGCQPVSTSGVAAS